MRYAPKISKSHIDCTIYYNLLSSTNVIKNNKSLLLSELKLHIPLTVDDSLHHPSYVESIISCKPVINIIYLPIRHAFGFLRCSKRLYLDAVQHPINTFKK